MAGERPLDVTRSLSVLDVVPACVIVIDVGTHTIVEANRAAESFFGAPRDVLLGASCHRFVCPSDQGQCPITDQGQVVDDSERLALTFDGRAVPVVKTVARAHLDGRDVLIESFFDIGERKRAATQLAMQAAELKRSNEDLAQFASVVSHDLQEPLRAVSAFLQVLQEQHAAELSPEGQECVVHAVQGAERMRHLIQALLALARVRSQGQIPEPTLAQPALDEAVANLHSSFVESGGTLSSTSLPCVHADHIQLVQVFQNLLSNALKYHGSRPPQVHVSAQVDGGWATLAVRDNGIGIEAHYLERIFEPFERLHSRQDYPGTGIGLAVCRKIIERHGGNIWVESSPGAGSTFRFTLPVG